MDERLNPKAYGSGQLAGPGQGAIQKEQSITELSHMIAGYTETVAAHVAVIVGRLEGPGPQPQGPPQSPEQPLAARLRNSADLLCKVDQVLSMLERKLFG